mmetsp:Transcript_3218/g.6048  ORF Transcript_3218/g.6048 Transcript_3218/m.6048 type:complete len:591 (+) Transcript_3218:145-1917(+)
MNSVVPFLLFSFLHVAFGGSNLNQPTELKSENGLLEVTLTVADLQSIRGGKIAPAYNGEPIGPTLRVKPGDTLRVTLVNNLRPMTESERELYEYVQDPANEEANEANVTVIYNRLDASNGNVYNPTFGFWGLNLVNLHFHGAQFPPSIEQLDLALDGGESKTYTFEIAEDHEPGLFWYHNHVHGTTSHAYLANLYGFIVIEGTDSDIDQAPGIQGATEVFMMLSEGLVDPVTKRVPPFFPIVGAVDVWFSVSNGYAAAETNYVFETDEVILFRVASAGLEPTMNLFIPGQTFVVVARDGFPLAEPEEVEVVQLSNGGRVEFLAKFEEAGSYAMSRQAWGSQFAPNDEVCKAAFGPEATYPCISYDVEKVVANITVVSPSDSVSAAESKSISDLIASIDLPDLSEKRMALADEPAVDSKTVSFDMDMEFPIFQVPLNGEPGPPGVGFGINGRLATPHHSSGNVTAGTCENWTVISNPPGNEHAFHIHGAKFLVFEVDGIAVEKPFWRDTIMISANFTAKVCFDSVQEGDKLLVHCHSPSHMDIGMLTFYEVVASNEETTPPDVDEGSSAAFLIQANPGVTVMLLLCSLMWL